MGSIRTASDSYEQESVHKYVQLVKMNIPFPVILSGGVRDKLVSYFLAIAEKPHSCFTGEYTKMVDITFSTVLGTGILECNSCDQILVLELDNVEDC